jgi:hypothetical protein
MTTTPVVIFVPCNTESMYVLSKVFAEVPGMSVTVNRAQVDPTGHRIVENFGCL